jgi:hypothetical protein
MSTALAKLEVTELEKGLVQLQSEAKAVVKVTTAAEYANAGQILVAIRNYQKDVKNKLNPFVDIAKRAYDAARQEMNKYINQAEELQMILTRPMEDFKRREREAAAAEERRINEERRIEAARLAEEQRKAAEIQAEAERKQREKEIAEAKRAGEIGKRESERLKKEAAENQRRANEQAAKDAEAARANVQEVTVQPATPKISSLRGRVNYYAEVVDEELLLREFIAALPERRLYLRQFICANDKAISAEARTIKDSQRFQRLIPGIRAWDEDSI